MRRRTPPLEAIEAFIVATRFRNFREAANELALSPSAFSRRIQALEAFVGVSLFERSPNSVHLSEAGEHYRNEVGPAIESIRRATIGMRSPSEGTPLRVIAPQSFSMAWLVPRLPSWSARSGGTRIALKTGHSLADLKNGHADVGILVGPIEADSFDTETLIQLEAEMVSAPVLRDGRTPPRALDELADYPRVAVYRPRQIWESWLKAVEYDGPALSRAQHFESMFLTFEAAAAGLGVALGVRLLAESYLRDGRLQPCVGLRAPIGLNYSLVFADRTTRRRADCKAFVHWLQDEMFESKARLASA